jgi:transposase InsO family protein
LTLPRMREISVVEQRYRAVQAVVADGRTVTEVAGEWKVSRQTRHSWLARYEADGLEGLADKSHRPVSSPQQMAAEIEATVLEMRRARPYWGPRRLILELAKKGATPVPSESAIYRCLVRAGVIEPVTRQRRREMWKRWERGAPMEFWQMDVVGGFLLADGQTVKALTGVDDHSRFCVSATLMPKERTQLVCDGFTSALERHGVPQQVLTDNGKVFTGKFAQPPVEVLFDRICRENGVEHLLTQPRSPTTTGKIERWGQSTGAPPRGEGCGRVERARLRTAGARPYRFRVDRDRRRFLNSLAAHRPDTLRLPSPRLLRSDDCAAGDWRSDAARGSRHRRLRIGGLGHGGQCHPARLPLRPQLEGDLHRQHGRDVHGAPRGPAWVLPSVVRAHL